MRIVFCFLFLFFFSFCDCSIYAQSVNKDIKTKSVITIPDSSKKKYKYPSPKVAAAMSAVIPGLGQAYNKSWWKIPVVYVGLGTIGAIAYSSSKNYNNYKKLYIQRIDTIPNNEEYLTLYSTDQLFQLQEQQHRRRDLMIVVGALFYVANIVDAAVDAHLFHFDVSPDLSMDIAPYYFPSLQSKSFNGGLTFSLKF